MSLDASISTQHSSRAYRQIAAEGCSHVKSTESPAHDPQTTVTALSIVKLFGDYCRSVQLGLRRVELASNDCVWNSLIHKRLGSLNRVLNLRAVFYQITNPLLMNLICPFGLNQICNCKLQKGISYRRRIKNSCIIYRNQFISIRDQPLGLFGLVHP